jgi:hypothetical protein
VPSAKPQKWQAIFKSGTQKSMVTGEILTSLGGEPVPVQ